MLKGYISFISGLLSFLAVTLGYGQKAVIVVTDQTSKEPVAFCHVCFEGINSGIARYAITDIDGKAENSITELSKIAISYVGYKTFFDTIAPGESMNVQLKPSVLSIDEVVVTAQYVPERADKSIYKVDVISARQIEQKAATNMADLLKDQPTMRVTQDAIFGTSLKMQGLSGENVKFLMDGVPMIGRMNGNFDLNQINLYNVDHIEVIEGPMSVIYGSNALAGVINIITKESRNSRLNTTAGFYTESVGVYNFDAGVTYNKNKSGYSLTGGRNFFGGYSVYDTSRNQSFKPRRQYFFDGYYTFTEKKFKVKLAGDYFNELLLDKGSLLPPYYETAFDNEFSTIRYSLRSDVSIRLTDDQFISVLAAYSAWNRQRQTYFNDLTTLSKSPVEQTWARDTSLIKSITARASYAKNNTSRKINYQAGIDLTSETGSGEKIAGGYQVIGDYALYASLKWDPLKSKHDDRPVISLQPGIRFIYNTKYNAPVVYALSAKWSALPEMSLRFSYSKGFRAPSLKELYLSFVDFNHDIQGNPDLQAESSNNFNLNLNYGAEYGKISVSFDATGFFNLIDNVILLAQLEPNTAVYTYKNVSKYKSTGFQVGTTMAFYPSLKVQAGFSLTGITGAVANSLPYEDSQWSPEVTLSPSYQIPRIDLNLALFYKYTGKSLQLGLAEDQIGWLTIAAYNTMDFTATKGFWNSRIKLSAGVKNIFDNTTIATTGNVFGGGHGSGGDGGMNLAWGRTFFLRLAVQFNKYK